MIWDQQITCLMVLPFLLFLFSVGTQFFNKHRNVLLSAALANNQIAGKWVFNTIYRAWSTFANSLLQF